MEKINNKVQEIADLIEENYKIFFWIIFALAFALNIYKFGEIPEGLHVDEAGMAIDANYIAKYGVDRQLNKFPVYFINYGGGQNALYTYLTAILIKIFGKYNLVIIRIPALILSMIEVAVCYLLVQEFCSKKMALCFMFLITIAPWHIMKSRWGLESYLFSPMQVISLYLLIKAIKADKHRLIKFFIAGLFYGITLYSYAISYIVLPIFLLAFVIYLIVKKQVKIKEILIFALPLIVLAIPLILLQMVQKDWIPEIHSFITIPKLTSYRMGEINIKKFWQNWGTLKCGFLDDYLRYNSIREFGTMYYFGTALMVFGLIITIFKIKSIFKDKKLNLDVIMILAFLANIFIACVTDINTNKINGIFIYATYFELVALKFMFDYCKVVFALSNIVYVILFFAFSIYYFALTPKNYYRFFGNGVVDACQYVEKNYKDREIYGDMMQYAYYLYANPIPVQEFRNEATFETTEIAKYITGYGHFHSITSKLIEDNIDYDGVYITFYTDTCKLLEEKGFKEENKFRFYRVYTYDKN